MSDSSLASLASVCVCVYDLKMGLLFSVWGYFSPEKMLRAELCSSTFSPRLKRKAGVYAPDSTLRVHKTLIVCTAIVAGHRMWCSTVWCGCRQLSLPYPPPAIREEIREVEEGRYDKDINVIKVSGKSASVEGESLINCC